MSGLGEAAVSGAATKVTEILLDPIIREISYFFNYQNKVNHFKSQIAELGLARRTVERRIDYGVNRGQEIDEYYRNWMTKVEEFDRSTVTPIREDEGEATKPCFKGLCPNFIKRYILTRRAAKAAEDCANLLKEVVNYLSDISYDPALERGELTPDKDYEHFGSRLPVFQNIMDALEDSKINMIGVCGMGGMGKSMLVREVARRALLGEMFDAVATADVTHEPDWKAIQEKIAHALSLNFDPNESAVVRNDKLHRRLKAWKRVLIILDDIWKKPVLGDIGIRFGNDEEGSVDNQRRCTLLFTSRNERLLRYDMNIEKIFPIGVLSAADAKSLFEKIVDDSPKISEFPHIASDIVGKCGGLPIAIKTIANTLKGRHRSVWMDVANSLNKCNPRKIQGLNENLSFVEVSYKHLPSDEERSLFELCGLQNDSSRIATDVLMRYGVGLDVITEVDTLEVARHRLHTLTDNLKDPNLLFDGDNEDHVKMHEIIHAFAVSIATDKLMFNIQNVSNVEAELENKAKKNPIAISIPFRDICVLPQNLECSTLKLFSLFMKVLSLEIPETFFQGTPNLLVLDLSGIHFRSLSSSLSPLTNLRTLSLERCLLEDVATIGELQRLEILSFRHSEFEKLPGGIRQLTRLKLLDLSHCSKLTKIEPDSIRHLSQLEELYMGNSFMNWELEGRSNASLVELKPLLKLTSLEVHIPDLQVIPQDLVFKEFERYRIFVGDGWVWSNEYETSRTLKLKLNKSNIPLQDGVKKLVQRTENLHLDAPMGFMNVFPQFDNGEGLPRLKHLHVQNGPEILYVVNYSEYDQAFSNLRIINIQKCQSLKHLFSLSVAKNLLRLKEIDVSDCKNLEMIVGNQSCESHDNRNGTRSGIINFTELKSLTLRHLPVLRSSVFDLEMTATTSSSKVIISQDHPDDLWTLFNEMVTVPYLEKLILSSINIKKIWLNQFPAMSSCGRTLTILTVEKCSGLKFLFSCAMVTSNNLNQLQRLDISHCKSMEEVIDSTGLGRDEEKKMEMVFPKLVYLSLSNLPKLKRFGVGNSIELPSLHELRIDCCPDLKSFISSSVEESIQTDKHALFDEKVVLPSVGTLRICSMENLRNIWHQKLVLDSFSKLEHLEVESCYQLLNIFPSSMRTRLKRLKHLTMRECNSIEEIIEDEADPKTLFDQLSFLMIKELPRLKKFEQGRSFYIIQR